MSDFTKLMTTHVSPITDQPSRTTAPGRSCPASYGYLPTVFARPAELQATTLYVIGGLYGNLEALTEIEGMAALEPEAATLVFNGDFHWFDAEPALFAEINERVLRHAALRGNVETELASDSDEAGCGCAYPESVPDEDVARSNHILRRLRDAARCVPAQRERLRGLPMHAVAQLGDTRIGIVHGDAWALAGWRFAHNHLFDEAQQNQLAGVFDKAALQGFACSHTCLPALKYLDTPLGERFVVNNGAAGMPNFEGSREGLITRIALAPVPKALAPLRRYGVNVADVYVDALAVPFDTTRWDRRFAELWPTGSPAEVSYARRIAQGPQFSIDDALGRGGPRNCAVLAA